MVHTAFARGPLDWSGLEVLSVDECTALLESTPIGRVGFVDAGEPVILPVNYAWIDRCVVFRSGLGGKLSAAASESPVCFEIDAWDPVTHLGFSVVVKGTAEHVIDDETVSAYEHLKVRPWSSPEVRTDWVRIRAGDISGRRIVIRED